MPTGTNAGDISRLGIVVDFPSSGLDVLSDISCLEAPYRTSGATLPDPSLDDVPFRHREVGQRAPHATPYDATAIAEVSPTHKDEDLGSMRNTLLE